MKRILAALFLLAGPFVWAEEALSVPAPKRYPAAMFRARPFPVEKEELTGSAPLRESRPVWREGRKGGLEAKQKVRPAKFSCPFDENMELPGLTARPLASRRSAYIRAASYGLNIANRLRDFVLENGWPEEALRGGAALDRLSIRGPYRQRNHLRLGEFRLDDTVINKDSAALALYMGRDELLLFEYDRKDDACYVWYEGPRRLLSEEEARDFPGKPSVYERRGRCSTCGR